MDKEAIGQRIEDLKSLAEARGISIRAIVRAAGKGFNYQTIMARFYRQAMCLDDMEHLEDTLLRLIVEKENERMSIPPHRKEIKALIS